MAASINRRADGAQKQFLAVGGLPRRRSARKESAVIVLRTPFVAN